MVPEYLTQTPLLCNEDSKAQPIDWIAGSSDRGRFQWPPSQPKTSRWGLLGPAARIAKGVNETIQLLRDGLTEEERAAKVKKEERRQILVLRMKNAETMEQWRLAAKELDILEGNEEWKLDNSSSDFDAPLIQQYLKQLDDARTNRDIKKMLNLVRSALSREVGNISNVKLYKHSHIGTKYLIERYIDSTLETIRALVEMSKHSLPDGLQPKDILEQVVCARQAFGRSALLLSGGATFGMNHVGVLKALYEEKLLPRIISGASAGSIVCAVLCTRTDEEIPTLLREFPYGDLAVFEEEGKEDSIIDRIRRLLTHGAWIDIKHLVRVMRSLLGDMTFQEAYNRTRRILNICVSSASVYELPRLLNYVTSPNVMIWSAVAASCSVPFLFSAAQLLVKNPITGEKELWNPTPQRWIDGSVDNDLPMTRLAEMFNVNHFIVSQVNPHVVPFLAKDDVAITEEAKKGSDSGPGWVYTLTHLAKDEAMHRMHMLAELGIFPNLVTKARSVLSQKYSGDITILPDIDYKDFPRMLKNPTPEFMIQACLGGQRATWPKVSRIRNHCAVELELDSAVQVLRTRVVFSPSQVDLRRMSTVGYSVPNRGGKKRRDSDNSIRRLSSNDENDGTVHAGRSGISRPPLRTASTYWIVRSHPTSPHVTPRPVSPYTPFQYPKPRTRRLSLQIPDVSSAGETTFSPPGSDADVDTHTDDSSPEPDMGGGVVSGLGLYSPNVMDNSQDVLDFFSSSQPVTPGTDHVLATSPASSRQNLHQPVVVKDSGRTCGNSSTEPNSPEIMYKKKLLYQPGSEESKLPQ